MPTLVIVGAQWGDEAKGKLVDVLSAEANIVVRYSGGNNAGHTIITGDKEFRFHLIPAGILHPGVKAVLAGGMVVCPKSLLEELETTRRIQSELGELVISSAAHVVFPYHRLLDRLEEEARGENKIGTTSRGIGPAYEDKVARLGIRMGEFVDPAVFPQRFHEVLTVKNRLLQLFGEPPLDESALLDEYSTYAAKLKPYVQDTDPLIQAAVARGEKVLFEGAQGTFLDLDCGTYPYVTSSHPIAGGACLGTGIGPRAINSVLGVCKAYTTRVGSGPFPTELLDATGERIREIGREYGTTTGRGRRCGWLDLVLLKDSSHINSLSGWVLTRLDILSGFETIKVCTAYECEGQTRTSVPASLREFAKMRPVYQELPGWSENLCGIRRFEDLPANAQAYVRFLEEQTQTPVAILSIGPDREQTIVLRPELLWPT
jgi:adenylosuccinate synthase